MRWASAIWSGVIVDLRQGKHTLGFQVGITFIMAVFLFAVIPAWMVGRKRGPRG